MATAIVDTKSGPNPSELSKPAGEPKLGAPELALAGQSPLQEKAFPVQEEPKLAVADPKKSDPAPGPVTGTFEKRFKGSIGVATGGTLYSIAQQL